MPRIARIPALRTDRASGKVAVREQGGVSLRGTVRKQNEDRYIVQIAPESAKGGGLLAYVGVFDGHGGSATAQWLTSELDGYLQRAWQQETNPEAAVREAFIAADKAVLAPKPGFLGMVGERGKGGSKCGSTAAVALLYEGDGKTCLVTGNVGDARVVLVQGGTSYQLTTDHVPDSEDERLRIEAQNPNPKMPLVRYVGGTWRVGGILALSRAFGDAYLKGSGQFEGVRAGGDGYSSGFGVVAEPYTETRELTASDTWLVVASDGLFANEERGGGGGLTNQEIADELKRKSSLSCEALAKHLAAVAVEKGSTDDVTVVVLRLGQA
ncbi:hypothetical protein ACKKBG_A15460 [Auxenochlorella protothecoides x Auxenochlorella symbiontica]